MYYSIADLVVSVTIHDYLFTKLFNKSLKS